MRVKSALLLLFICGCVTSKPETTGLERSENVLSAMEESHEQVQKVAAQLDRVETSLSELIRKGQSDIKGTFKEYSQNVNELDKFSKNLFDDTADLQKKSDNYLGSWENENNDFENSELQKLSAERREELSESHKEIFEASERTENELKSFLTDVKEIRNYLDNDLTTEGIESVTSLSRDVLQSSDELHEDLEELKYALEDAIAEMIRR